MLTLGLALSLLVGVSLGLLGGGDSILTVSILVAVIGISSRTAIAMSLVVIAAGSAVGLGGQLRHVTLDWPLTAAVAVSRRDCFAEASPSWSASSESCSSSATGSADRAACARRWV